MWWCDECRGESIYNPGIFKEESHVFKILRSFILQHTNNRSIIASMNDKATLDDWKTKVVKTVKDIVSDLCTKEKDKDIIETGLLQSWGGSYRTVPYWRCQPYFRAVNGVTGDKRQQQKEHEQEDNNEDLSVKKRKVMETSSWVWYIYIGLYVYSQL